MNMRNLEEPAGLAVVTDGPQPMVNPAPPFWHWPMTSGIPDLGALASAPGLVRAHIRATLALWNLSVLTDAAEVVASEFVSNSIQAVADPKTADKEHPLGLPRLIGGGPATIAFRMRSDGDYLLIEVWDADDGMPVLTEAGEDDESGRGLALVDALCATWGWGPHEAGGKVVYGLLEKPEDPEGAAEHARRAA